MRQICSLHPSDITRLLQGLVTKSALVQEGQTRWSRYRLPAIQNSEHIADGSEHKTGDSEHIADGSEHKTGDSEHNPELMAIAAPARMKHRLNPGEMERIILELCRNRWLTRNKLAGLLDRHPDGLRNVS
jgi:ATP-dependent DNA helicase RecG